MLNIKTIIISVLAILVLFFPLTGCVPAEDEPHDMQEEAEATLEDEAEPEIDDNFIISEHLVESFVVKGEDLGLLPRKVGSFENGSIYSDQTEGFLFYGPYIAVAEGEYQLLLEGEIFNIDSAWVDITSNIGESRHAVYPVEVQDNNDSIITKVNIVFEEPTENLEVRMYIYENEEVRIDGYELIKIDS